MGQRLVASRASVRRFLSYPPITHLERTRRRHLFLHRFRLAAPYDTTHECVVCHGSGHGARVGRATGGATLIDLARWIRDTPDLPIFSILISRNGTLVFELYTGGIERPAVAREARHINIRTIDR